MMDYHCDIGGVAEHVYVLVVERERDSLSGLARIRDSAGRGEFLVRGPAKFWGCAARP